MKCNISLELLEKMTKYYDKENDKSQTATVESNYIKVRVTICIIKLKSLMVNRETLKDLFNFFVRFVSLLYENKEGTGM